jgi:hypothetical protein
MTKPGSKRLEDGSKAIQRGDAREDRLYDYKAWHYSLGIGFSCSDLDQVEWGYDRSGRIVAVAVLEMTRCDDPKSICKRYFEAILERCEERDKQCSFLRQMAAKLETDAWYVVFLPDLSLFYRYNLTHNTGWDNTTGWQQLTQSEYKEWLQSLRAGLRD